MRRRHTVKYIPCSSRIRKHAGAAVLRRKRHRAKADDYDAAGWVLAARSVPLGVKVTEGWLSAGAIAQHPDANHSTRHRRGTSAAPSYYSYIHANTPESRHPPREALMIRITNPDTELTQP